MIAGQKSAEGKVSQGRRSARLRHSPERGETERNRKTGNDWLKARTDGVASRRHLLRSDRRQNNQLARAFPEESRGETPAPAGGGTESRVAECSTQSPASSEQLREEVGERENWKKALKRVKANEGSPGIDGMTVEELPEYLKKHWPTIREQRLSGTYSPPPVKRVEIPKPGGGIRKLGIPTVGDRFVQQAVMQVLQSKGDPTFSAHS